MLSRVEHRILRVQDVFLYFKGLCHISCFIKYMLTQNNFNGGFQWAVNTERGGILSLAGQTKSDLQWLCVPWTVKTWAPITSVIYPLIMPCPDSQASSLLGGQENDTDSESQALWGLVILSKGCCSLTEGKGKHRHSCCLANRHLQRL